MTRASDILPRPLRLLLALRLRAAVRRMVRSLRTAKGILMLVGWVAIAAVVLLGTATGAGEGHPLVESFTASLPDLGPLVLTALLLVSVLWRPADRALVFREADVDLLFPAPFTRRQLLMYALVQNLQPIAFTALIFSVLGRGFVPHWVAGFLGLTLFLVATHLTGLATALLSLITGEGHARVWRRVVTALFVAMVGVGVWRHGADLANAPIEAIRAFAASWPGFIVTAPAIPFARIMTAEHLDGAFALWTAAAAAIDAALVLLVMRLDADWTEASIESSRRAAEVLERVNRTGAPLGPPRSASLRVPMPPRWAGVGPVAWRQLVSLVRLGTGVLWPLSVVATVAVAVGVLASLREESGTSFWFVTAGVAYASFILLQLLRLDFRADVDRMNVLKSLPVSPAAMALGQAIVPAVLFTLVQCIAAAVLHVTVGWSVPAAALLPPLVLLGNIILVSVENAGFLAKPVRPSTVPGSLNVGGVIVIQVAKAGALLLLAAAAAIPAVILCVIGTGPWLVAAVVGVILVAEAALVIRIVAKLFEKFDPVLEAVPDA